MESWELDEYVVTVAQLIARLQEMPQDAKVMALYDGFCKIDPECVWAARGGAYVLMASKGDVVYHDDDRPYGAPSEKDKYSWEAQ